MRRYNLPPRSDRRPALIFIRRPAGVRHVLDNGCRRNFSRHGPGYKPLGILAKCQSVRTSALEWFSRLRPYLSPFLFMAGVSAPFSIGRALEQGKTREQLLLRVIKRAFILVLLGLVANNGLKIQPIADIRFASVLGRIGIAYMFANIIWLYSGRRAQYVWFWALLLGYWLLLKFASAPDFPMAILPCKAISHLI